MNQTADHDLIEAVRSGDDGAAGRALADGADPNATVERPDGLVLAMAARGGPMETVRMLVEAGARIGPADPGTASPLRVAVLEARPDVTQFLLAHGALAAEPSTRSSVLSEALSYATFRPSPAELATLRVLLESGAVTAPGEEPLLVAAVMRAVAPAVLRLLLAHGADPGQCRSDGAPAIVLAARLGDHAAVDVLLTAGADVDARDQQGRTALMHAVERDERRVVATLLVAGAAVGAVSTDRTTALELARGWQHQSVQFMLGEHSAGLDDLPIDRTTVRIVPIGVRVAGDQVMLHRLASVVDTALDDLGDDEWEERTSTGAAAARVTAARLRDEIHPAVGASWYQLDATAGEMKILRSALVELAYGAAREMPPGVPWVDVVDLLHELDRQLGH
jgi:ankyrin repeat protein